MNHLSALNHFFWKYRYRFSLGVIFIILTNYFRILAPQLMGYVVNIVVHQADGNINQRVASEQYDVMVRKIIDMLEAATFGQKILWCGIIMLLLALISGLFMFLMRQTIIVMSRLIEYSQKNQVFNHYQELDTNFYKTHSTGDLMSRISEDISRVRMYSGPA